MPKICKVLVVEDHEGIRALLGNALEREGYNFTLVPSGDAGELIEDGDHEIVVIDVPLAHEDAFALAMQAAEGGVGVILTTGHEQYVPTVMGSGHRHILKPFKLEAMLKLVDEVVEDLERRCVKRHSGQRQSARR
jgi:DNA-binding NtrC family response regulator